MPTIKLPTPNPIPISAPRDNPLPLELDELFVGLEEVNGVVVDTDIVDDEVVVDVIDGEAIIDVADIAASGFPHWVGMY
jgi:hypothetical protein